mgnify:CR=1 FL=1
MQSVVLRIRFKLPQVLKDSVQSLILGFSDEQYDAVCLLEEKSLEKVEKDGIVKLKCEIPIKIDKFIRNSTLALKFAKINLDRKSVV